MDSFSGATVVVYHKRTRSAAQAGCPNGGPKGKESFTVSVGTTNCPHCRGGLIHQNTGQHIPGKTERRERDLARLASQ